MSKATTLSGLFSKLDANRQSHLNRVRKCSELTIPALLPPDGADENTPLPTPYQGLGARAVNNLSAKLLLTLLPPNSPFFRYKIPQSAVDELKQALGDEGFKTKIERKLSYIEKDILDFVETEALRVPVYRAVRYLVVTGNSLLYVPTEGDIKIYRLDKYVVRRDPKGKVLEILIKEGISQDAIPEGIRNQVEEKNTTSSDVNDKKTTFLYTHVRFDKKDKKWHVVQAVNDILVPGSQGTFKEDECPYRALTWTLADGENYGRGHVEEYLGDFISLESLSQSIVEGSAIAALVKFLLNPNGTTEKKELINTKNGGVAYGNKDDISVLQVEKYHDFRIAYDTIAKIEMRISQAFLLKESVRRDAERVTAEEIRLMAQELEDSLGGIYSVLSQEFQLPLVKLVTTRMQKLGRMPELPKEVKPVITTGLEALGRGHDLTRLNALLQQIAPLGEEAIATWLNIGDYIQRAGIALGVDMDGLVRTQEQVDQVNQQNQQMTMMQQLMSSGMATQGVKGVMDNMNKQGATD